MKKDVAKKAAPVATQEQSDEHEDQPMYETIVDEAGKEVHRYVYRVVKSLQNKVASVARDAIYDVGIPLVEIDLFPEDYTARWAFVEVLDKAARLMVEFDFACAISDAVDENGDAIITFTTDDIRGLRISMMYFPQ